MAEFQPIPTRYGFKDLTGLCFSRWTVLGYLGNRRCGRRLYGYWLCQCACGTLGEVDGHGLRHGTSRSCGCLHLDVATMHGMSHTTEHMTWCSLFTRCDNPNSHEYKNYGGRGIGICQRWRESFANFYADMGPKPSPTHSIDRIDNEGDYEPSNCRWATGMTQNRNQRTNVFLTHDGETLCLTDWAKRVGISTPALSTRLQRGWSVADAVTTPRLHMRH